MRPRLFLLLVFLSFLIPRAVSAQTVDYVSLAIDALQSSNVYVAPGTERTDYNTPAELNKFLTPELNVVLVMLPGEALIDTDILTIAQKISVGLNNEKTVGLAVGNVVIGYSTLLPEGVASDLMNRADSVSNNTVTALTAFSRNVQLWLIRNPQPTPFPTPEPTPTPRPTMEPIELPKAEDVSWPVWALFLLCFLSVGFLLVSGAAKTAQKNKVVAVRKKRLQSLQPIEIWIQKIEGNVAEIRDVRIRKDLGNACNAAYGLLEIFRESNTPLGYTEAKFPSLLSNVNRQVVAFIRHESGRRPLSTDNLAQLRSILLNYDAFFVKLQENDPDAVELLTSMIDSNNAMISSMGYLPEDN